MPELQCSHDPAVIEHRLLDLVTTTDSAITAPAVACYTPCSLEDADRVLERLVAEQRLRVELDDHGHVTYVAPDRAHMTPPRTQAALAVVMPVPLELVPAPNPAIAAILSLLVPGTGQLYAGRPVSAVVWFLAVAFGYLLLIVPGLVLHILCIASAASAAHRVQHAPF